MSMPNRKQIWVSPSEHGWKVHREGSVKASRLSGTKKEALEEAIKIARNQGLELKVQRKDGKIQMGNSYGGDPFPPRG